MDKAENYYCFSEGLEGRVWTEIRGMENLDR